MTLTMEQERLLIGLNPRKGRTGRNRHLIHQEKALQTQHPGLVMSIFLRGLEKVVQAHSDNVYNWWSIMQDNQNWSWLWKTAEIVHCNKTKFWVRDVRGKVTSHIKSWSLSSGKSERAWVTVECLLEGSKHCSVGKLAVGFGVEIEKCLFLWCRIALLLLCVVDARVPVEHEDEWSEGRRLWGTS